MVLYELPRGSYFKANVGTLLEHDRQTVYQLDHLDGMYSLCFNPEGGIIHWSIGTPVIPCSKEGKENE